MSKIKYNKNYTHNYITYKKSMYGWNVKGDDPELLSTEEIDKRLDAQLKLIKGTLNKIECELDTRFSFKPDKTASLYSPYTATSGSYTPPREYTKEKYDTFFGNVFEEKSEWSFSEFFSDRWKRIKEIRLGNKFCKFVEWIKSDWNKPVIKK